MGIKPKKPKKPERSKRLVSFDEFISGKDLRRTFLAGFKMYAGKEFMTYEEWTETLTKYQNR